MKNPIAAALRNPMNRRRVVQSKRIYSRKRVKRTVDTD